MIKRAAEDTPHERGDTEAAAAARRRQGVDRSTCNITPRAPQLNTTSVHVLSAAAMVKQAPWLKPPRTMELAGVPAATHASIIPCTAATDSSRPAISRSAAAAEMGQSHKSIQPGCGAQRSYIGHTLQNATWAAKGTACGWPSDTLTIRAPPLIVIGRLAAEGKCHVMPGGRTATVNKRCKGGRAKNVEVVARSGQEGCVRRPHSIAYPARRPCPAETPSLVTVPTATTTPTNALAKR